MKLKSYCLWILAVLETALLPFLQSLMKKKETTACKCFASLENRLYGSRMILMYRHSGMDWGSVTPCNLAQCHSDIH